MDEERVIKRTLPAELVPSGDGRTLDLRIVPFNTVARVADRPGDFYEEMWMPGCFEKQRNAANRVLVNFEHERGLRDVVGRGIELRDTGAAAEGTFRILPGPDGDKALELVNEKVLTGVSLEAIPEKTVREDGVVKRVKARLINIALCRFPAYDDASILAVREAEPPEPVVITVGNTATTTSSNASNSVVIGLTEGTTELDREAPLPPEDPPPDPDPPPPDPEQSEADKALGRMGYVPQTTRQADELLARIGYESLVERAIVRKAWDGSPSRFTDEEYQRSCLIDRGGDTPPKERCSLPVLEPNGDLNVNAMAAAAAALAGARGGLSGVSSAQKAAAARKLVRLYRQAEMDPPPSMMSLAGR